jgi:uncharacterized protein (DUF1697 family)
MTAYVALLRGINVGGKNLIRMPALKACFEDEGFTDVRTYIQSGNVVFTAGRTGAAALTAKVERMLRASFDYEANVVVRDRSQLRAIVDGAPDGFGADPARYRSDVIFLKPPLTARSAIAEIRTREGVDTAATGPGVLYFERLTARATQSYLSKIVASPIYQRITIRNWNTTTKLLALMDGG